MRAIIQPSNISGEIFAPASKSSMQRACAAALARKGKTIICNAGKSNDDKAALDVIKQMGCEFTIDNLELIIDSNNAFIHQPPIINHQPLIINCGESGLGIRMFTPLVALSNKQITINGEGSLLTRPMDFFDAIFPQLGVEIISNNGKLPLKIKGPLQAKNIEIDGSLSSQFLTGLLMAYSAANADGVRISVKNLKSKPYIDLTLKVMKDFVLNVPVNDNYETFYFQPPTTNHQPSTINYTVEGDWSGAAFLLVAGAVAGNIIVSGLDIHSTQADKKILEALKDCGCNISIKEGEIQVERNNLKAFGFDATDCPDLFPPLAALAANCVGTTVIEGVHRLAHKESDRAVAIQTELKKMNVDVELKNNLMLIHGCEKIKGALVHSHHDHRIAMMCAVLGLNTNDETSIDDAEAINKSYTDFYKHLQQLGVAVSLNNEFSNH
jgi:3-phosphoshikimate 1-carboxyvinyltransferase